VTPTGPVDHYLASLHTRLKDLRDGEVAAYIPELAKADPDLFGIAIATVDGKVYTAGDSERTFTIQSTSKPFIYCYILAEYGREAVLKHVGVEPTGEAFNSILLDEVEILGNMMRDFSERLRRANDEIRALEG
jgi:glutaminase